ncbi:UNVERIFIED_CONTAM: hypothetical protein H355_014534, partial [Colinus virginianus]
VIYIARNPKDVLVSYFHFSKFNRMLEKIPDFNIFMERFLAGKDYKIFFSGTVWTQNILSLILHEGHRNGTEQIENLDRIPWVEYNIKNVDLASLPTPRVFATHLPYYLTPRDLRNKKGRVIYVARNPKDVLVSYFHFSKFILTLEKIPDFNIFMERFLAGKACSPISDSRLTMEPSKEFVFNYKGFYFSVRTSAEHVASLENFEIKDSDIFIATYPKSGTVWTQNILSLILHEGHRNGTEQIENLDRIPWVEYNFQNMDLASLPTPRVFATHLPYYLTPRDLRNKKGRVIYVARNPKDVLVSYFHFSKFILTLEKIPDFNIFMERFLAGKVLGSAWFDHVSGWYNHANDFNILFLTYEEMKKVIYVARNPKDVLVSYFHFSKFMRTLEKIPDFNIFMERFLAGKGTVGDWKNMMTVAQSERFDEVLKEKMQTLPIKFTWDMDSDM